MTSTTDVATRNGTPAAYQQAALAISPGQAAWDAMQLAALAQLGIKDASEGDRAVFLHVCQRTGLDPFSRQIYMIPRPEKLPNGQWGKKWTIQTGIDGFRVNRSRAERLAGVRGILSRPVFYDPEGKEFPVWTRREPPVACEITYTVRDADGTQTPYTSILRFAEYVQMKDGKAIAQWAPDAKPVHMLEKCTEADVYRKAFPQDFAGVYLEDAMPVPEDAPAAPAVPQRASGEEIRNRPRRPQRVQATVATPDVPPEDAPWPGDAAPATGAQAEAPDPRDDVTAWFGRAGITSLETQMNYAGALLEIAPPASLDSLARVQAVKLRDLLARCEGKAQLDAFLKDGTVPGSE